MNDKIRPAPEPRPLTNAVWGKGQPVLAWVNGKYCKGTVLFYEGRSQPPSWAIEYTPADKPGGTEVDLFAGNQLRELPISTDEYPVGSKVRLKMRRQSLEGVVRNVDEQRGLTVEVQSGGRRPRPMQVRISSRRMIEQYELELVDAAHETK